MNHLIKRILALAGLVLVCFVIPSGVLASSGSSRAVQQSDLFSRLSSFMPGRQPDAGSSDGLIHTFDFKAGERANSVAFSPDSGVLVVGTALGVHFFDLEDYREVRSIRTDTWVRSIALSPDGSVLAGALFDDTIRLWRVSDGVQIAKLTGHRGWVRSVVFSPNGTVLASASDDNTVRLWRIPDGMLLQSIEKDDQGVRSVAFSPDGKVIAAGTADGSIHLWDAQNGTLLKTLRGHEGWIRALAFSHDGNLLASGAFDATARIWRIADGALIQELKGHNSSVLSVAFTPEDGTLATGSVDSTIRLWRVPDGKLRAILAGHTSFVYGIAISSDGTRLASGSEDSTMRLWDISQPEQIKGLHPQSGSGDCRLCHHPRGTTIAPPVLEVRCEACHSGGAALNWCPTFPRLTKAPFNQAGYTASANRAGVPVPSETLSVVIASPGNGETYYVWSEFTAPLQVRGHAGDQNGNVTGLTVTLEVWSGDQSLGTLQAPLQPDGGFSFDLGINPGAAFPVRSSEQIDAGSIVCDTCHTKYSPKLYVREGDIRLAVSVTDENGERAIDERWVNVDFSTLGLLEVRVVDAETGEPVQGVLVQASTRLYEWRPRSFSAISNADGIAQISPEILRQASTIYSVSISNQIAGGIFYKSVEAPEVVFPPDNPAVQTIVLQVISQRGAIHGKMEVQDASGPEVVWALQLPAGPAFQTEAVQGVFSFQELPVAKYLVFSDTWNLKTVDLTSVPESDITLQPVTSERDLSEGIVTAREAGWVPFAWLTLPDKKVLPMDLANGTWKIGGADSERGPMMITAPGYYSQLVSLEPTVGSENSTQVSLIEQPGLRNLRWGNWAILLPPESDAVLENGTLSLESGWAWGNSTTGENLKIDTPEAEIRSVAARFALSRLPEKLMWFYLQAGEAQISSRKLSETITVRGGTMAAVGESGEIFTMPYEPQVFAVLNLPEELPVPVMWEPTLSARVQKGLFEAGLTAAQVVTYVTYLLVSILLVVIAFVGISLMIRRQNRPEKTDQHGRL